MADPDRDLPDPGHEEPCCEWCDGAGTWLCYPVNNSTTAWYARTCPACRGTGRPRCPDCEWGTARTGPGRGDEECCERCDGTGVLGG